MDQASKSEILARLQGVFRRVFDEDSIVLTPQTTASDIPEWDSLNQIKIILECEREFKIRLRPREINALENVNEMVEHLAKAVSRQQGNG
jgi:acyl carrier protein